MARFGRDRNADRDGRARRCSRLLGRKNHTSYFVQVFDQKRLGIRVATLDHHRPSDLIELRLLFVRQAVVDRLDNMPRGL